jgi:DNA-binding IclR family transcriptional regulator
LQLSAPVFDPSGSVTVSIMVLGSMRTIQGEEVSALAQRVVQAADRATTLTRQLRLGETAEAI